MSEILTFVATRRAEKALEVDHRISTLQSQVTEAKAKLGRLYKMVENGITDLTMSESQLLQAKNVFSDAYSTALSAAATLALSTGALGSAPR